MPPSLQALTHELGKLPGVGQRTALRFAVALLQGGEERIAQLGAALEQVAGEAGTCPVCHFWTQCLRCPLCEDNARPLARLCVVRSPADVLALEKFRNHPWKYHVLQGLLSPLHGVGPAQIRVETLFARLAQGVEEVILALDATVEGDATALFLREQARRHFPQLKVSRTALGLPAGSAVEYLDSSTLESALEHRTLL